jgi:hypothetical protein
MNQPPVIAIYTTRGDAEVFLRYPYLYNRLGEWIGWVTPKREVYSVLGIYVGELTTEPRILRKQSTASLKPRKTPPPRPPRLPIPATVPLAPLMAELRPGMIDVLAEEPFRLHPPDAGELREDMN